MPSQTKWRNVGWKTSTFFIQPLQTFFLFLSRFFTFLTFFIFFWNVFTPMEKTACCLVMNNHLFVLLMAVRQQFVVEVGTFYILTVSSFLGLLCTKPKIINISWFFTDLFKKGRGWRTSCSTKNQNDICFSSTRDDYFRTNYVHTTCINVKTLVSLKRGVRAINEIQENNTDHFCEDTRQNALAAITNLGHVITF